MKLNIDIQFDELLALLKQLPAAQIAKIRQELSENLVAEKAEEQLDDFKKFLLNGPIMSDEQYKEYLEERKRFKKWRTK